MSTRRFSPRIKARMDADEDIQILKSTLHKAITYSIHHANNISISLASYDSFKVALRIIEKYQNYIIDIIEEVAYNIFLDTIKKSTSITFNIQYLVWNVNEAMYSIVSKKSYYNCYDYKSIKSTYYRHKFFWFRYIRDTIVRSLKRAYNDIKKPVIDAISNAPLPYDIAEKCIKCAFKDRVILKYDYTSVDSYDEYKMIARVDIIDL